MSEEPKQNGASETLEKGVKAAPGRSGGGENRKSDRRSSKRRGYRWPLRCSCCGALAEPENRCEDNCSRGLLNVPSGFVYPNAPFHDFRRPGYGRKRFPYSEQQFSYYGKHSGSRHCDWHSVVGQPYYQSFPNIF